MEEKTNPPVETPSDHDEPDVVVKPKRKMNISDERRQELRERMKVIAAERHAKLKEAREDRIKAWNQDPPPRPCDIGKGKYKHQPKPVVHDKGNESSSEDELPDPSAVLDKQKKSMEDGIRHESEASKRAAHNKAVANQLREDKKREADAKKAYDEGVLNLKLEREKLEKERKEFEARLVKDKATKPPPEKPSSSRAPVAPAPVAPAPVAPPIRGKFVR